MSSSGILKHRYQFNLNLCMLLLQVILICLTHLVGWCLLRWWLICLFCYTGMEFFKSFKIILRNMIKTPTSFRNNNVCILYLFSFYENVIPYTFFVNAMFLRLICLKVCKYLLLLQLRLVFKIDEIPY